MGGTPAKQVNSNEDRSANEDNSFHMIELHGPSLGLGFLGIIFVIIIYMICRRYKCTSRGQQPPYALPPSSQPQMQQQLPQLSITLDPALLGQFFGIQAPTTPRLLDRERFNDEEENNRHQQHGRQQNGSSVLGFGH